MRIAILSDTRQPTLPDGGHGLGRSAFDIAAGLLARKHHVTLFAAPGSEFDGRLVIHDDEITRANYLAQNGTLAAYDAILDTSHHHQLSKLRPAWPVVNRVCDLECKYRPPNVVVNSPFMQAQYGGRLINTGIKLQDIPLCVEHDGYLAFMGKQEPRKGWPEVGAVARQSGKPLLIVDGATGAKKWQQLGHAAALLHPSFDAAPRTPLEAAACGVPTLCLNKSGTPYHVADRLTGYVCSSYEEMSRAVHDTWLLSRYIMREWVADTHGYAAMVTAYEEALTAVADGERWV